MTISMCDDEGYPCPPLLEPISWDNFKLKHVEGHPTSTTRSSIFTGYQTYLQDFKQLVGVGFKQWVNGSFTSSKMDPGDIDVVCFLAHDAYGAATIDELSTFQTNGGSRGVYHVDAYIIPVYPTDSVLYITRTLLVANDWASRFGFDKVTGKEKDVAQLLFP